MLHHLTVQNYALIDHLEIDFSNGLTIITGETGAGKSILLGALGLIAGNRADTQSLQDKTKKCIIEAVFKITAYSLQSFFELQKLDYEETTTIRREINPEGKSRAFINDTPVTLNQLKELAERLIDIHSQHQTLTLNGNEFQLSVIDAFAKHTELLKHYATGFKQFKQVEKKLQELIEKETQAKKDHDYYQFQYNELEEADLTPGKQQEWETELEALNNAEEIKRNLSKASFGLTGGEINLLSSLSEIKNTVTPFARLKPELHELSNRINSTYIELKDIGNELENIEQDIVYDPKLIEEISSRLNRIYKLQQKHQVKTIEELIAIKDSINTRLLETSSLESAIEKNKLELDKYKSIITTASNKITSNRKNIIPKIEKELSALLHSLSMPNAQLKIEHTVLPEFTSTGQDKVSFLFSANKGSDFKELNKVASGGELSRLMLSIKSSLAKLTALPTIIFDEIDTGVSGDVADKIGMIMSQMATSIQVITITHLPQIASKGDTHLFVYKSDKNDKTYSAIKKLTSTERVQEIAKMLSTGNPTEAAINNAKELLQQK